MKLQARLASGMDERDATREAVRYRLLEPGDDLESITRMLHAAYAPLAEAGMNFTASYQDSDTTRRRVEAGTTVVAVCGDEIVGVVTLRGPGDGAGAAYYARPDVAAFGQFAVAPRLQGRGIGSRLLVLVEELARESGAAELALDTSERAAHLISMYERRGYRSAGTVQWDVTNYRSVILSKRL
jgi:GNAT superfamily N-acetyltransferase